MKRANLAESLAFAGALMSLAACRPSDSGRVGVTPPVHSESSTLTSSELVTPTLNSIRQISPESTLAPGKELPKILTSESGIRRALIIAKNMPIYQEIGEENGLLEVSELLYSDMRVIDDPAVRGVAAGFGRTRDLSRLEEHKIETRVASVVSLMDVLKIRAKYNQSTAELLRNGGGENIASELQFVTVLHELVHAYLSGVKDITGEYNSIVTTTGLIQPFPLAEIKKVDVIGFGLAYNLKNGQIIVTKGIEEVLAEQISWGLAERVAPGIYNRVQLYWPSDGKNNRAFLLRLDGDGKLMETLLRQMNRHDIKAVWTSLRDRLVSAGYSTDLAKQLATSWLNSAYQTLPLSQVDKY